MKILIVAATSMEVKLLVDEFDYVEERCHNLKQYEFYGVNIDILISGIGTTFTTYNLTNTLKENSYDLAINVGIAGSLTRDLKIGDVVNVISEEFADLGIEEKDNFLTLFEAGFMEPNEYPFDHGVLKATNKNGLIDGKKVRGVTANRSHGRELSIAEIHQKFSAHIETMEGAAVFYVCNQIGVPCHEIRAISNFVELRDSSKWNIPLALENLKESLLSVLKRLSVPVN